MQTRPAGSFKVLDCRCSSLIYAASSLILLALCTDHLVSCKPKSSNSDQIEQKPLVAAIGQAQEQIELRTIKEESLNEVNRQAAQDKCTMARRNLDSCSAQLLDLTQVGMQNVQEIDDIMCPKFKQLAARIKNSTDCYKPFEKQIINWVLTSTRRMNHKRCKNENEKQKLLRLTQSCFSSTTKNPMNKCMSTYIANLEAIADMNNFMKRLSEDDIQIQLACCANMRFKQCVMTNAKNSCKPAADSLRKLQRANSVSAQRVVHKYLQRSTYDMMDDLKQTLDSMALTGPEFICQSVDENFCQAKFDGRFQLRRPQHKSIVPAMISIYSNNH